MADQQELRGSNLEKDPAQWKTGDEPMTGAQASYLRTLSDQADEAFDENLAAGSPDRGPWPGAWVGTGWGLGRIGAGSGGGQ